MKRNKRLKDKKLIRYRFADELLSEDTKISLVSGGASAVLLIVSLILGIVKKGETGNLTGMMLGIALVLAITGVVFGGISFRDVSGSNNSKRYAAMLAGIVLVILIVLMVL